MNPSDPPEKSAVQPAAFPASGPSGDLITIRQGEVVWRIRREWASSLIGAGAPDWFSLAGDDRTCPVKRGHLRTTWRVGLGDCSVYAKVYEAGGLLDGMKRLGGGDPAGREWRIARRAAGRGVAVPTPLAYGRGRRARSVFLTLGVDSAVSLADAWASGVGPPRGVAQAAAERPEWEAAALREAVARLLADSHERGFVHGDGHPDNILVRHAPSGVEALYVDLGTAILTRGPVPARRAVSAIAHLNHYFRRRAARTERLRFLRAYLAARPSIDSGSSGRERAREWAIQIAGSTDRHARRLARQRDRRLLRDGKYFATLRLGGGWIAGVALRLERRHAFAEPDVPDRSRDDWERILVPLIGEWEDTAARAVTLAEAGVRVEPDRALSLMKRAKYTLAGSPPRAAFMACHARRHRDLPADLVLGYLEHRTCGLVDAAGLIRPAFEKDNRDER